MRRRDVLRTSATALTLPLTSTPGLSATQDGEATRAFEPLGEVPLDGAKEAVVGESGSVAYVAVGDGFVAVDIAEPASPSILAERRAIETPGGTEFLGVWDVTVDGDRLAVVGPAMHGRGTERGFALFDVSDPATPVQVAFHSTDFHIHNAFLDDEVVYLTGSGLVPEALVPVDISGDEPTELTTWTLADHDESWAEMGPGLVQLHDIYVQDGVAALLYWDAGTWLLDVSDPAQPTVLSGIEAATAEELRDTSGRERIIATLTAPGNHHYGQFDDTGDVLAVGTEAWAVDTGEEILGGPGGVKLYDVRDERNPALLAEISPPESFDQTLRGWFTTAHNFDFDGDRLYTAWYFGGVQIHDVSDPANPTRIAWWRNPAESSFWTAQATGETVVATSSDPTAELGISDPSVPLPSEALYIFPDRAGDQQNPPSLTDPPASVDNTTQREGVSAGNDSTDAGDSTTGTESSDALGPGFGPATGLAGVGGAGYLALRRLTADED